MKTTKQEIAGYYGLSYPTIISYDKKAKEGCKFHDRKLKAMYYYYEKMQTIKLSVSKRCVDENGQVFHIVYE